MVIKTDSIVLVAIDRLNRNTEPFGIRALVEHCQLADKTISKTILRLEASARLRVIRGEPGTRHKYVVLDPPSQIDILTTKIHLGEPINLNGGNE